MLLKYGTSEAGARNIGKYYRTATEEFAAMRPAFRGGSSRPLPV